jgi:DNA-binding LacI/PurR family transcriptional regulator
VRLLASGLLLSCGCGPRRGCSRSSPRPQGSLAGYDDIPFARDLHPALTTVHVPYEELGRLAVRTALGRTAEDPAEHLLLGTHVVVRDSVAETGT